MKRHEYRQAERAKQRKYGKDSVEKTGAKIRQVPIGKLDEDGKPMTQPMGRRIRRAARWFW